MSKSSLKLTKYMSEIKHDLLNNELNNILCLQIFYMNKNSVLPVNKKFNFKVWWLLGWWNIILTHQQLHAASGWLGLSFFLFFIFFLFCVFLKKKAFTLDPTNRPGIPRWWRFSKCYLKIFNTASAWLNSSRANLG
jgi:hypothetical protein